MKTLIAQCPNCEVTLSEDTKYCPTCGFCCGCAGFDYVEIASKSSDFDHNN